MEKPRFQLKVAELAQWRALQELHLLCFGQSASEEYFRWKYLLNPQGPLVGVTAWAGDEIAGFYGLIPELYRMSGKSVTVYQSMDTMTHPKFQRMGLFSLLAKSTVQDLHRSLGETPLMGIPGRVVLPGFVKAGWHHCTSFQQYFHSPALLRWQKKVRGLSVVSLDSSSFGWREYLQLRKIQENEKQFSERYFQWRVFDNPLRKLHVLGSFAGRDPVALAVFQREEKSRFRVLYIEGREDTHPGAALSLLVSAAQLLRGRWFYTWGGTNGRRAAFLRKAGFFHNPLHRGPFSHRVPLILRSSSANGEWSKAWPSWQAMDWQPLYQD